MGIGEETYVEKKLEVSLTFQSKNRGAYNFTLPWLIRDTLRYSYVGDFVSFTDLLISGLIM